MQSKDVQFQFLALEYSLNSWLVNSIPIPILHITENRKITIPIPELELHPRASRSVHYRWGVVPF